MLDSAARRQTGAGAARAAAAIGLIANEEAAKYLILLDTARCGRQSQKLKVRQLKRFNDHISKGVYANVVDIRPDYFHELVGYVNELRASHYLPDWDDVKRIYEKYGLQIADAAGRVQRNMILAEREGCLYVDFAENDHGGAVWITPASWDFVGSMPDPDHSISGVVDLVGALHRTGLSTESGLAIVDQVWNEFTPEPTTRWEQVHERIEATIDQLAAASLSDMARGDDARTILDTWTFPLHSIEVEAQRVDLEDLWELERERNATLAGDPQPKR